MNDGVVKTVTHVFYNKVDSGINAVRNLNPVNGTSGEISIEAKKRVMSHILDFVKRTRNNGLCVTSMMFGRGLMWLSDDTEAQNNINAVIGKNLEFSGDDVHAINDFMAYALSTAFGF